MSQQLINNGISDNDRSGDTIRTAFSKVNANFTELYAHTASDATDRLVNGTKELVLNVDGDRAWVDFPAAFGESITVQGAEVGASTSSLSIFGSDNVLVRSNAMADSNKTWEFDTEGTITLPNLETTNFTATVDSAHYSGEGTLTLTDDAWYFAVTFEVGQYGEVTTLIDNQTPWASNPGYTDGMTFEFTEVDHGIVGYTFTLYLEDIQHPSEFMWTVNLAASPPPEVPETLNSVGVFLLHGKTVILENGSGVHKEQFKFVGRNLLLPQNGDVKRFDGNEYVSVLSNGIAEQLVGAVDTDVTVTVGHKPTVSAACQIAVGDEFVADTEFNDDITVVQVGWTVDVGGTEYTVTSIDPAPPANQYRITATGATFVQGTTYTFTNPDATLKTWTFNNATGTLRVPDDGTIQTAVGNLQITAENYLMLNSGDYSQIEIGRYQAGGVVVLGGTNTLTEVDGDLKVNSSIRQSNSFTRTTSAPAPAATATVVWSANADWMSSIKLTIQVEGNVTGDNTGWHVQTCEATIASRGYANGVNGYGDPEMSVYGIIYTSTNPLATFEVQRNVNTRLVEVVATGTDLNNNITVSVHSVEIGTTD